MSLSDTETGGDCVDTDAKRLTVSRHAAALFWEKGVSATSGDDIAAAAGLSTRTIWRYFRTKESCVEPLLARSADRFLEILHRWPLELSLGEHLALDTARHPLDEQGIEDEWSGMRISTMTESEPALRTAYLMVHDRLERGLIPVAAERLRVAPDDLTVRLCAAAVTGAFRVIDEDVSRAIIVDNRKVTQAEALALMDRAINDATNGRLGGPVTT
ncbi:helix-turn-helix domain containing protein [Mycobacterium sp. CPCC 205372]|uniref:Helix-turn-helix domain containing protein n=1 Tax=Mycobacterium hippophais TaxID=3016340 RepID=A0ABT4PUM6_9MYCO|nr:helix-turn-helix domain-containing protein [Mycobacterium hippophais]MCZ8380273.1 helix-turn-helix domain containing protein [Mycobacterium hippophais]